MLHRFVLAAATVAALWSAAPADAQTYAPKKPRRQFISVSTDWLHTQPLHFLEYPLQDLVGRQVCRRPGDQYRRTTNR